MQQPEGFVAEGKEDRVCPLKKSSYGLKQLQDNGTKDFSLMVGSGYSWSSYDKCIYFHKINDGSFLYLSICFFILMTY